MTSIYEKKVLADVRPIHAEQMSLYNFIVLRKKQWTQMKTKQHKKDIPKLNISILLLMLKNIFHEIFTTW